MKKLTLISSLFLFGFCAFSQDFNRQKMDSLFMLIDEKDQGMGSLSILQNGIEVYQKSIGFADIENNIPANSETAYRIGSISKSFSATIIMQLVDEKKLSLDTKLNKFFELIPNSKNITIEQLMRHQSGLLNFTDSPDYLAWMEQPKTRNEMIEIIVRNGTVFEPGERAEYSNTNFVLLTYIAEDIENKSFDEILHERIVEPCNLKHTYYGGKINPMKNEALSYAKTSDWELASETDMSIPSGAGAVVSTPGDLNTFYNCLFGGKLVSEQPLEAMMNIQDNYGMGLISFPFYDKKAWGHTGGIDGFQSQAAYFPNDKVIVSYCTNAVVMSRNDILIGVLSIYFGKDYELPDFKPAIEVPVKVLDKYTGVYSTPELPMKITITREETILMAQGTGQPAFPLTAFENDKFKFEQAGVVIEFNAKKNKLILKQGGQVFEMFKEE